MGSYWIAYRSFWGFSILCFIEDTLSIHSASFEINMINIVVTNKSHWGIYIGHFWHPMNLPQFQVHLWKITNLSSMLIFWQNSTMKLIAKSKPERYKWPDWIFEWAFRAWSRLKFIRLSATWSASFWNS